MERSFPVPCRQLQVGVADLRGPTPPMPRGNPQEIDKALTAGLIKGNHESGQIIATSHDRFPQMVV